MSAANCFSDKILLEKENIYLTREELKETITGWLLNNKLKEFNYELKIDYEKNNQYIVTIFFKENINFFIKIIENKIILKASKINDLLLFTTISSPIFLFEEIDFDEDLNQSNVDEKGNESSDYIEELNNPEEVIIKFIQYTIQGQFIKAISFFNNEVWFEEFKIVVSNENIKQAFIYWRTNYEASTVEDVIDRGSLTKVPKDRSYFKNSTISIDGFYEFSISFKDNYILPGNTKKRNYSFLVERLDSKQNIYKIVGIAQF